LAFVLLIVIASGWLTATTLCTALCRAASFGDDVEAGAGSLPGGRQRLRVARSGGWLHRVSRSTVGVHATADAGPALDQGFRHA
jgi:hypothetical protein